jgi:phage baseplate assembly protein V
VNYELGELDRRLANIIRYGAVAEIDEANGLVKVDLGELVTDWLRWGERRAGPGVRTWSAPEVGEQVVVMSPGGELSQGIVGHSFYQDAYPQNANLKTSHRDDYADDAYLQYDRDGHHWHLDVPAGGSITLHIGDTTLLLEDGQATLTTPMLLVDSPQSTFTGNVTVQGNEIVQGHLTYQGGMSGSGGTGSAASITGNVQVTSGNVTADGVGLKTHTHSDPQGGSVGTPSG